MANDLGKVLLIANPVSQNGQGARASLEAARLLRGLPEPVDIDVATTLSPQHAIEIARCAAGYDTVLALGGDGIIHEAVNGLMAIPQDQRPVFGIIPVGSGNDYAKTLSMDTKNITRAIRQLLDARVESVDVGRCNGEFFTETVSFGLDAAIALDTVERRKRTGRTGTLLYLSAGLDQLMNHLDEYDYTLTLDDGEPRSGRTYMIAVQNGPSYGGGFTVAPNASIRDGKLDIVVANPPLSRRKALLIFMTAKNGNHTGYDNLEFFRAKKVKLSFRRAIPVQIDGEGLTALDYDIEVLPQALRVLVPEKCAESVLEADTVTPDYYGERESGVRASSAAYVTIPEQD